MKSSQAAKQIFVGLVAIVLFWTAGRSGAEQPNASKATATCPEPAKYANFRAWYNHINCSYSKAKMIDVKRFSSLVGVRRGSCYSNVDNRKYAGPFKTSRNMETSQYYGSNNNLVPLVIGINPESRDHFAIHIENKIGGLKANKTPGQSIQHTEEDFQKEIRDSKFWNAAKLGQNEKEEQTGEISTVISRYQTPGRPLIENYRTSIRELQNGDLIGRISYQSGGSNFSLYCTWFKVDLTCQQVPFEFRGDCGSSTQERDLLPPVQRQVDRPSLR